MKGMLTGILLGIGVLPVGISEAQAQQVRPIQVQRSPVVFRPPVLVPPPPPPPQVQVPPFVPYRDDERRKIARPVK